MGIWAQEAWLFVLDDLRRNDLAGTAPGSEAVKDEQGVLGLERLLPVGLSGEMSVFVSADSVRIAHDVVSLMAKHNAARRRPRFKVRTHEVRLCTPSLLIAAVLEKNLGVEMGR